MTGKARSHRAARSRPVRIRPMGSSGLARVLGVTPRHVARLAQQGMPRVGELYDPVACVRWYVAHRVRSAKRPPIAAAARDRKLSAEAEIMELALLERRQELIPRVVSEERIEELKIRLFAVVIGVIQASLQSKLELKFPDIDEHWVRELGQRLGDEMIAACQKRADDIDDGDSRVEAVEEAGDRPARNVA